MIPTNRTPTHPGEILLKDFLEPMGMTANDLADELNIDEEYMSGLINQTERIEGVVALKLGKYFNMSSEFWLNLQRKYDVAKAPRLTDEQLETEYNIVFSDIPGLTIESTPNDGDNPFYEMMNE